MATTKSGSNRGHVYGRLGYGVTLGFLAATYAALSACSNSEPDSPPAPAAPPPAASTSAGPPPAPDIAAMPNLFNATPQQMAAAEAAMRHVEGQYRASEQKDDYSGNEVD